MIAVHGRPVAAVALTLHAVAAWAQPGATVPAARVNILLAEERRAPTDLDLARLRTAARSVDPQTARLAIRALGRLERPAVIDALLPALRHRLPETRAEAAHAIGQAAGGWRHGALAPGLTSPSTVLAALSARLDLEDDAGVRAALCETIGRLPYRDADEVARAEAALVARAREADRVAGVSGVAGVDDRLGAAKGLEALARGSGPLRPLSRDAVAVLRTLSGMPGGEAPRTDDDLLRDGRVRRLALEALITAREVEEDVVVRASRDPDPQVRRLAQRAAVVAGLPARVLANGLDDPSALVRLEALGRLRDRGDAAACRSIAAAAADAEPRVALVALDLLASCGASPEAVALLERTTGGLPVRATARGWHYAAHAIVALSAAAPDRAVDMLDRFVQSEIWQVRMYAARAVARLRDRRRLEQLAYDANDNVVEAAIDELSRQVGHAANPVYVAALSRTAPQAVRAGARALAGVPDAAVVVPALEAALARLTSGDDENSSDVRAALAATLTGLGSPPPAAVPPAHAPSILDAAELRRLASPRARITVTDAGTFDLALFTAEAPATVLRFAQLAEAGYYDGLTFHRVEPNFVVQGGSPGANEYVGLGAHMRDEVGAWPHVRGTVGLSTRGRDTGDAQFFINLVDNPRLDHEYTVFGQILNGTEVVDRILEGDVIERIEILP